MWIEFARFIGPKNLFHHSAGMALIKFRVDADGSERFAPRDDRRTKVRAVGDAADEARRPDWRAVRPAGYPTGWMTELSHGHSGRMASGRKFDPSLGNCIADRLRLFWEKRQELVRQP